MTDQSAVAQGGQVEAKEIELSNLKDKIYEIEMIASSLGDGGYTQKGIEKKLEEGFKVVAEALMEIAKQIEAK